MTSMNILFPPEYLHEVSMSAFEIVIAKLRAGNDELRELAEAADAAFLIWQLAEDQGSAAQQSIGENLPILINTIYRERDERDKP